MFSFKCSSCQKIFDLIEFNGTSLDVPYEFKKIVEDIPFSISKEGNVLFYNEELFPKELNKPFFLEKAKAVAKKILANSGPEQPTCDICDGEIKVLSEPKVTIKISLDKDLVELHAKKNNLKIIDWYAIGQRQAEALCTIDGKYISVRFALE